MYLLAQPVAEMLWMETLYGDKEVENPLFSIIKYRWLEDQIEDNILDQFISATTSIYFPQSFFEFDYFLREDFQEKFDPLNISAYVVLFLDEKIEAFTATIEISPWKCLIINARLGQDQRDELVHVFQAQSGAFS